MPEKWAMDAPCEHRTAYECACDGCKVQCCMECDVVLPRDENRELKTAVRGCLVCRPTIRLGVPCQAQHVCPKCGNDKAIGDWCATCAWGFDQ